MSSQKEHEDCFLEHNFKSFSEKIIAYKRINSYFIKDDFSSLPGSNLNGCTIKLLA